MYGINVKFFECDSVLCFYFLEKCSEVYKVRDRDVGSLFLKIKGKNIYIRR